MLKRAMTLALCYVLSSPSYANQIIQTHIPNTKKVGEGRLSVFFWDVFDAVLYAPNGHWNPQMPYALSIRYFREIEGTYIAERSVEEMKKQGYSNAKVLEEWYKKMLAVFPDVKDGTELTALFTSNKTTVFYQNGKPIGTVNDPLFGKHFFDIWLGEKTSEPALRKALLGEP